jgi:hypothetical protein
VIVGLTGSAGDLDAATDKALEQHHSGTKRHLGVVDGIDAGEREHPRGLFLEN